MIATRLAQESIAPCFARDPNDEPHPIGDPGDDDDGGEDDPDEDDDDDEEPLQV